MCDDKWLAGLMGEQTDGQTDRQTDRHRQTDRGAFNFVASVIYPSVIWPTIWHLCITY